MIAVFFLIAVGLAALIAALMFVQLLYMESMRVRARELPSLAFFRETLEDRLGIEPERGTLAFSIGKHTCLLLLCFAYLGMTLSGGGSLLSSVTQAILFSWLTMLLSAHVLPSILYRKTSAHWVLPLVPVLRGMALAVRPLTSLLGFLQSLVELAQPDQPAEAPTHPSEHIEALITAGEEEGLLEEDDRKLIHSVVAFGDKTVRNVMTPRPNIVAIDQDRSLDDLRDLVIHEQYSRIPVYKGSIDLITGFVHVRDMFELDREERHRRKVIELARPMRLVPETKPVNDLLKEMQRDGAHMSAVIDEYGNTAGLVTMEDMVEEILGEIHDEHEPDRDMTPEGNDTYVVSGSLDLDRLGELFGFRPDEETESTTIGGLVSEWLRHVPHRGEIVEREGLRLEVLASNEVRVEQVRVSKAPPAVTPEGAKLNV